MRQLLVAAALVAAFASVSLAHDTWVLCTPPRVDAGGIAAMHMTSGMAFPAPEAAPSPERIVRCEWRVGGTRGEWTAFEKRDSSLVASGRVSAPGVAVVCVEFRPREIDLEPDEVEHYLEEIGAPESVRRAWEQAGPDAAFHETYTKHAKTYLRVGQGGDATGALEPVGFAIDFLPDRDPTALTVGDTLAIRVVRGGDGLEGYAVGTVGGNGKTRLQRTNASGAVTIAIDAPGWWLVRGTELRHRDDGTWESNFTTLTFFVESK